LLFRLVVIGYLARGRACGGVGRAACRRVARPACGRRRPSF